MISRIKDAMAVSERLDELSAKLKIVGEDASSQSTELAGFRKEIEGIRAEMSRFSEYTAGFRSAMAIQLDAMQSAKEDLKKEVFDFKMIKGDVQSRLVADIAEDLRTEIRKECEKLDTDVKKFNQLKDELSSMVAKFRSAESEIDKFREVASEIKSADFTLANHAKELAKADAEKLRLKQRVDQLEHLISKMRRGQR